MHISGTSNISKALPELNNNNKKKKCFATDEVAKPWTHRENILLLMRLSSHGHTEKVFCY